MFLLDFHKVCLMLSVKWNDEILAIVVYLVLFSKHPQKSAKGKLKHHILWRNVENLTKLFSFTPWIQIRIKILGRILISINIMQIQNTDPSGHYPPLCDSIASYYLSISSCHDRVVLLCQGLYPHPPSDQSNPLEFLEKHLSKHLKTCLTDIFPADKNPVW